MASRWKRTLGATSAAIATSALGLALALGAGPEPHRLPPETAVTIVARERDPRLPVVREVVDHWNVVLSDLGASLALAPVTAVVAEPPDAELAAASARILSGDRRLAPFPAAVEGIRGDVLIVLANRDFISFATPDPSRDRAMVAIKSHRAWPLTLPNVLRNVIAHELGHALGLGHNADPATLMCGRPAPCRPEGYAEADGLFPLTPPERQWLLGRYPRVERAVGQ